jgi:Asp-tRNA(Asn)/Glu-tRNA(Gln) amidotransferase A subunit family amidase
MARTVADAVAVFQVVAGADPADSVTSAATAHRERDYTTFVKPGALRGARIGILRQAYERPSLDTAVARVFATAVADLRAQGAVVIDTARVDSLDAILRRRGACNRFKADLERYLAARAPNAPVHTLDAIVRSRRFHPTVEQRLRDAQAATEAPEQSAGCAANEAARAALRVAVVALMDSLALDALVYPTWSNPPRLIGDLNTPAGDNSQIFSPLTGFPAITVPMGWTPPPSGDPHGSALPAGMTFFGRPWSEGRLIGLAYGYEQATHHRHPPASTPRLGAR